MFKYIIDLFKPRNRLTILFLYQIGTINSDGIQQVEHIKIVFLQTYTCIYISETIRGTDIIAIEHQKEVVCGLLDSTLFCCSPSSV